MRKSAPASLIRRSCPESLRRRPERFFWANWIAGLGHNTFSQEALALIVRSGEGLLRRTRNLCVSCLIEAVRDQTRIVDLKQVNHVLIQPHWRKDCDQPLP